MNALNKYRTVGERKVIKALVRHILGSGNKISVYDGEEWVIKQSHDEAKILDALGHTDYDTIRVRNQEKEIVGSFLLVYGNASDGSEVIADYSDNSYCGTMHRRAIVGII